MNKFDIKFISPPFFSSEHQDKVCLGKININAFEESFLSPLSFWTKENYQEHWRISIQRMLFNKVAKSCLITSMYNPQNANFILWWLFYRDDKNVHIQNQILFFQDLEETFNMQKLHDYIPERKQYNHEGQLISEWKTNILSLERFLNW
ncbi:Immunity protein CdiI [Cylindrospermum sp. NIES-4074]|nr:Immunity protein CdiI [Cylindrospermum sp. NIES-4074]